LQWFIVNNRIFVDSAGVVVYTVVCILLIQGGRCEMIKAAYVISTKRVTSARRNPAERKQKDKKRCYFLRK